MLNLSKLKALEKTVSQICKPFQYFEFVGYVELPAQKCKICKYVCHDRREHLVEHLKKVHGVKID